MVTLSELLLLMLGGDSWLDLVAPWMACSPGVSNDLPFSDQRSTFFDRSCSCLFTKGSCFSSKNFPGGKPPPLATFCFFLYDEQASFLSTKSSNNHSLSLFSHSLNPVRPSLDSMKGRVVFPPSSLSPPHLCSLT